MAGLTDVAITGVAMGSMSYLVTQTWITRRFRKWIDDLTEWGGRLVNCPLCFGTWLCIGAETGGRWRLIHVWYWFDLPVTALVMVVPMAVTAYTMMFLLKRAVQA